ncbi:MAG: signal peptidase I [Nocardioides sp.]|uniref:signal peptidase I n=1 Tax=Nocardioides sp. TaxID=35761 RepID=UPI0039E67F79
MSPMATRRSPTNRGWRALVMLAGMLMAATLLCSCGSGTRSEQHAYFMPSSSMEPTIPQGSTLIATVVHHYQGHRGDIVVFDAPTDWLTDSAGGGRLVKRVIGVGGDTVGCCDARGRIEINGKGIDEPYIGVGSASCNGPMAQDDGIVRGGCRGWSADVPDGRLFLMGDNRGDSVDSSYHLCSAGRQKAAKTNPAVEKKCLNAFVPADDVVGTVAL